MSSLAFRHKRCLKSDIKASLYTIVADTAARKALYNYRSLHVGRDDKGGVRSLDCAFPLKRLPVAFRDD
jgi:hypothetical protein